VPELTEDGRRKILGVTRVSIEPDGKKGEIAFIVADPWQGLGLGTKMVDYALEICKDMKIETVYAIILPDNYRAINLMKKMGFTTEYADDGTVKATLNLREEEQVPCSESQTAEKTQPKSQEPPEQRQAERANA
jgi:acetyltransferase